MQVNPTVSIVIPAYQTADLIPETLVSVSKQTLTDYEVLIIDDGSTDFLERAVAPFLTDVRFSLYRFANRGPSGARNQGIARARGRCIAFLDGDDLMEPTYLEEMVAALDRTPGSVVSCCDATLFGVPDREGRRLSEFEPMDVEPNLANVLERRFLVYGGATMYADAVRAVGNLSQEMWAAEDFDLWVRLLLNGGRIAFVPKALARYRRRAGSLSNTPTRLHMGRAQAYLRALGSLNANSVEAAICRRKIGEALGLMEFHEGERALVGGDIEVARARLRESDRQGVLTPKWRVLRLVLSVFPGLAARIARKRQESLAPLARLSAGAMQSTGAE